MIHNNYFKKARCLISFAIIFIFQANLNGQIIKYDKIYTGIGLTGGSLNTSQSITGGMSIFIGRNFLETRNSSFALCTNLKIGTEDRTGLAIYALLPLAFANAFTDGNGPFYGPNVNVFAELPILFHYNWGFGSGRNANDRLNFGFYLGGGFNYVFTGYNDASGKSTEISFSAYTTDLGIRFRSGLDINLSASFSIRQQVGQIQNPKMFGLTISKYYRHYGFDKMFE